MSERIDFSRVRFLIVDGNPLFLDLLHDILRMMGTAVIYRAGDSDRALRILSAGETDVAIMEWALEPQTGMDLLRFIRSDPASPNAMLPVVMLTANSEEEFVVAARDMGVTEFLAKPFTVEGLYRRLVSVIARPRPFVRAEGYFGPDRRRRQVTFDGPDRRRR